MDIKKALSLTLPCVASVVGCGGKTSLIKLVANSYPGKKRLIAPTTKMYPLSLSGVDFCGDICPASGKAVSPDFENLAEIAKKYQLVLLEADGSRGLPLKGWRPDEPAVHPLTTQTIGVLTLAGVGRLAVEEFVHNLDIFLELTGMEYGEQITLNAIKIILTSPAGLFKGSRGERIVLINQVEDEQTQQLAKQLLGELAKERPGFFSKLLFGSIKNNVWQEVPI